MAGSTQAPTFGTDLITRAGSEALLRQNDEEIRLLESMRSYFSKRAKADQDYAKELSKLRSDRSSATSGLHRTDSSAEEVNPIFKVGLHELQIIFLTISHDMGYSLKSLAVMKICGALTGNCVAGNGVV